MLSRCIINWGILIRILLKLDYHSARENKVTIPRPPACNLGEKGTAETHSHRRSGWEIEDLGSRELSQMGPLIGWFGKYLEKVQIHDVLEFVEV